MNLVGRPVRIKGEYNTGQIGVVTEESMGMFIVKVNGKTFGYTLEELEPWFSPEEVVKAKVTKTDDDGDPEGITKLEKLMVPFGMSSADLAEHVVEYMKEATERVTGVGNDQYTLKSHQKFEELDIHEVFNYADEEILDLMNYLVMVRIRLMRIWHAVSDVVDTPDDDEAIEGEVEEVDDEDSDA